MKKKLLLGLVLLVAAFAAASSAPTVTDGDLPPTCVPGINCQ